MAYYITTIDILYPLIPQADLTELLDDDQNGSYDPLIFAGVVAGVEALFHSYVMRRYTVPLTLTGHPVREACAKLYCSRLMEYYLYSRRKSVTPEIKARYDQTLVELEKIRDGKLGLDDPPPAESSVTACQYTAAYTDRDFTATSMAAWGGGASRNDT